MRQELEIVNELWRKETPFALYRLPYSQQAVLVVGSSSSLSTYSSVGELPFSDCFVIAPFSSSSSTPIVTFSPTTEQLFFISTTDHRAGELQKELPFLAVSAEYRDLFDNYIEAIRSGRVEKLVLARQRNHFPQKTFSPLEAWREACALYPQAYVYLTSTPITGLWLGASPEVLLSGQNRHWYTTALAGTQPLVDGELPAVWSQKNREEQAYVATYIRECLHSLGIEGRESEPYTVQAASMAHLKTDFFFSLSQPSILPRLLELLHPTPAVCGFPKKRAMEFILEQEKDSRSYYSGFLGRINPQGATDIYVNIRCLQSQDPHVTLYAGGGIVASSEVIEEWIETERKMNTMSRLIASVPSS